MNYQWTFTRSQCWHRLIISGLIFRKFRISARNFIVDQEYTSSVPVLSLLEKKPHWKNTIFWHETFVHSFHVIFHFIRPRKLLLTHGTGKHFPLVAFVVQKRVSLETILVFKCFLYIDFGTFSALVHPLVYRGVSKQIQTSNRHFRELLGGICALRCCAASHSSFDGRTTRRGVHWGHVRRGTCGRRCWVIVVYVVCRIHCVCARCRRRVRSK